MKAVYKEVKQFFYDNFIMPKDIKAGIITKNLRRLAQLEEILFIFGFIMCTVTAIRYHFHFKPHLQEYLYYLGYVVSSLHVLILAMRSSQHPDWPVWRRNIPTYTAIFELLFLCVLLLYISSHPLAFYTVYTNVCIISIVMLAVEPGYFIIVLLGFATFTVYKLNITEDWGTAGNMILTTIIMWALSLFRWNTQIKEFKFEKSRNNHIEAMEKEIQLAAFVQESFTKKKIPELDGFEVAYYSKAMSGVSGDMYDFYTQGRRLKGVGIFDVSGHGIASGLVTMLVRNIIQQEFHGNEDKPLFEVMEIIDKRIRKEKRNIENYLTGVLLRMNGKKVEIVNAGHPSPVIFKKANNSCIFFDDARQFSSSVIGLSYIDSFFQETSFNMENGDEIILYTDGVKEAQNPEHDEFGAERFMNSVKKAVQSDLNEQIQLILTDMGVFTQDTGQSDDVTIVIIKKK